MQMKCALLATGKSSDRRLIYANEAVPIEINLASPSLPPSLRLFRKERYANELFPPLSARRWRSEWSDDVLVARWR